MHDVIQDEGWILHTYMYVELDTLIHTPWPSATSPLWRLDWHLQFSSKFRITSSGQAFVGVATPSYCVVILWVWSQSGPVEIMGVLGSRIISPIVCFIRGVDLIDPHSVPRTQMRQWSSSMMWIEVHFHLNRILLVQTLDCLSIWNLGDSLALCTWDCGS